MPLTQVQGGMIGSLPSTGEFTTLSVTSNLSFNSGYGSSAVAYGCRAWVNFNGTGTVAIRASGNVSSITDNGSGDYTVNFTNAMPDANYAIMFRYQRSDGVPGSPNYPGEHDIVNSSSARIKCYDSAPTDCFDVAVAIFR